MKRGCLLLLVCFSVCIAQAQGKVTITNMANAQAGGNGMFYALPMTVFDVDVYATKTLKQVGPYWKYANRCLGITDAIRENETIWHLDKIVLRLAAIPDPAQYYQVTVTGNAAAAFLSLTPDGIIQGVNVSGIAAAANDAPPANPAPISNTLLPASATEGMVKAGAKFKEAEEAANQIFRLREGRTSLITGDNEDKVQGSDAKTLLTELDKQEKQLLVQFTGQVYNQPVVQTVRCIPSLTQTSQTLFRFSMYRGVVDSSDLSGTPVLLTLTKRAGVPLPPAPQLSPEELKKQKRNKAEPHYGFYYRRPGKADLSITYQGQTLIQQTCDIAQFGDVLNLAPEIGERPDSRIVFFPQTGAIKEISRTSNK